MAPQTPTGVPSSVTAGDSWRWRIRDIADYPQSEGWSLVYRLAGVSVLPTDVEATFQTSGDDAEYWLVEIPTTDTATLAKGRYRLIGRMVGADDYEGREETVSDGVLLVLPDPRSSEAGDFQTHEEKMLAAIEARLEGRLTEDMEQYGVAGRTVLRIPFDQLTTFRAQYAAAVRQQRTGSFGRTVEAVFR